MALANSHSRSSPGLDPSLGERGYAIVRQLFDAEEIQSLRASAQEAVAEGEREGLVTSRPGVEGTMRHDTRDLLSISQLRHVLLDQRVVEVVRELLGGEPVYFGDSSVRIGKNGERGWHRANVNRRRGRGGPDWRDPYPVLGCGLYLQDLAHHSGGLAVRP